MEFWPYFYTYWSSDLILPKTWILISIGIGIVILSFQILEFWLYPCKHWNFSPFLCILEFWPYFYHHWNSDFILPNIRILALFLYTLEFWSFLSNTGILVYFFFTNIGILILSFQTLEFWPHFYKHFCSYLFLSNTNSCPFL